MIIAILIAVFLFLFLVLAVLWMAHNAPTVEDVEEEDEDFNL
jgi:preprotein translocase subunit SecG